MKIWILRQSVHNSHSQILFQTPKKRKNVYLNGQYRKRKHSKLSVGDERDQSQKKDIMNQRRRPLVRLRSTSE